MERQLHSQTSRFSYRERTHADYNAIIKIQKRQLQQSAE